MIFNEKIPEGSLVGKVCQYGGKRWEARNQEYACTAQATLVQKEARTDEQMQQDKKRRVKPWQDRPSSVSPCPRQGGQVGPGGGKGVEEAGEGFIKVRLFSVLHLGSR